MKVLMTGCTGHAGRNAKELLLTGIEIDGK
jgi:nucleoside-diphosphate-sugar epimerase